LTGYRSAAISPLFIGFMFARSSWINVSFLLAGALKILYDLLFCNEFVSVPPVEERSRKQIGVRWPISAGPGLEQA
jgi:hypothetical protein